MKYLISAMALVFAAPVAAQTAPAAQHQGHGTAEHAQHAPAQHGQHQSGQHPPGQHQGHEDGCCADRNNNGRMDCCENMQPGQRCCCEHGEGHGEQGGHQGH